MVGMRRMLRARLELWEVLLAALFVALVLSALRPARMPDHQSATEIDYFRERYGPGRNTEREEEWLIRDFFRERRGGVFVDVGANHHQLTNKTYFLETELDWSGIAIEPQRQFAAGWAEHRPRTRFFPLFVSEASDRLAELHVLKDNPSVASADREFVRLFGEPDEVQQVPTVSLTDLLDREGIQRFDFLSMDIELHEPQALRGFDIERFRPSLVCIEALLPIRQQILDYFAQHGYVVVGRYVWVDRENLYFMPLGTQLPAD